MINPVTSTLVLAAAIFAPLASSAIAVEKTAYVPKGWNKIDSAVNPQHPFKFSIALRQPHMHTLKQKVLSGSRLSLADTEKLSEAAPEDVGAVLRWLADNGIKKTETRGDWIDVYSTIGATQTLLSTKLQHYAFEDQRPVLRTTEYHIPDELEHVVSFIHPITNFMLPKHELGIRYPEPESDLTARDAGVCAGGINPDCIKKLYNVTYKSPDSNSPARFAVAGFLSQFANHADADTFLSKYAPTLEAAKYNFSTELVNGGQNPQQGYEAGSEANLDIQYALALGYPSKLTYYSCGGKGDQLDDSGKPLPSTKSQNEPYLDFLQYLLNKPDDQLPHVLSLSYADDELSVPLPYAQKVCNMFGMLTGRGVTVFGGSGDGGARGAHNSTCVTHDGTGKKVAMITFPASCPYVTSVGAVSNKEDPPSAASFSTGGFSQYFPRESWQDGPVNDYIAGLNGYLSEYYDPKGRAIPDISAVGTAFSIVINGRFGGIGGTSASTPLMASLFVLINDARLRAGKKSLGWINGHLYSEQIRGLLQDITVGGTKSCDYNGQQPGGWKSAKGWDATTGNGVPADFQKLFDAFLAF